MYSYIYKKNVCFLMHRLVIYFDSDNLYLQELINLSLKYVSRLTGSTTLTFKLLLIYERKGAKNHWYINIIPFSSHLFIYM